jgi:high affinity Mn2+ porin
VRRTIDLGGTTETLDSGLNQFRGTRTTNRLVATVGKFSVSDIFDTIGYAHDPRGDFMNWSLVDAGTFDYAADAWGFTYGAALEWYQGHWVARGGLFDLSFVPNSAALDSGFEQYQVVYELEHQHTLKGAQGKIALVGFVRRGRMGTYTDALAEAAETGTVPNTADVRRFNGRPGLNVNVAQQVASDVGVFARVGWADGSVEPYEFTDIDRTASAGVSIAGSRWGRRNDVLGIATVFNGASDAHRAYLAAGGLGILVGDGQLPHPGVESILESYYRLPIGAWQLTADYQLIVNPAFNRDRGPVSVVSARVRTQF